MTQSPPQDTDSAGGQPGSKAQTLHNIWLYWATAGALAIITTLITVIFAAHNGSGAGPSPTPNPTASVTSSSTGPSGPSTSGAPTPSSTEIPPLRRQGRIDLNTQDLSGVDLDSMDPDWSVGDITRHTVDLYFGGISRDLSGTRGTLSATDIGPDSFRECQASTLTDVDINEATIEKLPLICLTTDQRRIAVVKIVSYDEQQLVFDVAVWKTSDE